ncbi:hypothetical protein ACXGQW_01200 [Wenyingzhuangia sp. IMCC45533]
MKKIFTLCLFSFFTFTSLYAANQNSKYEQPFVFVEKGVEYAVFKNGEFDFNILNNSSSQVYSRARNLNISFNSGCNYTPYVQRNRYGDVTAINRTNIFYDGFGRVIQIGNISIDYNRYGYLCAIGGLYINYQNYGNQYTCSGYINSVNHYYKPVYNSYQRPTIHHHLYQPKRIISKSYVYNRPSIKYRKYDNYNSGKRRITRKEYNNDRNNNRSKKFYSTTYNEKNKNRRRR